MFEAAIKAVIVITAILGAWLLVQAAWRRVFKADLAGEDVHGCFDCHGCSRPDCLPQTAADETINELEGVAKT